MEKGRLKYVEGIRGLMALNVILCHFVIVYYPQMYFGNFAAEKGGFLSLFATSPLSALVNGDIAVRFFLVITGFFVGRTIFLNKNIENIQLVIKCGKRYARLLPMVAIATLLTFLTMVLGLQTHKTAAPLVANPNLMLSYCDFEPSIGNLLANIFVKPFVRESEYVSPFWMLRYEFWGYILVVILASFLKDSKFRRVGYVVSALFVFLDIGSDYLSCVFGLVVADLLFSDKSKETLLSRFYEPLINKTWFKAVMFVPGLYFATCPMDFTGLHAILGRVPMLNTALVRGLGMALIMFSTYNATYVKRIFENRVFLWLGKVSFGVFALHFPIMLSILPALFMAFRNYATYDVAAVGALIITLPIIYLAAFGAQRLLEQNWIKRFRRAKK